MSTLSADILYHQKTQEDDNIDATTGVKVMIGGEEDEEVDDEEDFDKDAMMIQGKVSPLKCRFCCASVLTLFKKTSNDDIVLKTIMPKAGAEDSVVQKLKYTPIL